jgi:hypothetical protein
MIQILGLALIFALADRALGMDRPAWAEGRPWKGPVILLLAVGAFGLAGPVGAAVVVAWTAWRTPAWGLVPGASMTPETPPELAATLARHAIAWPLVALAAWLFGADWQRAAYAAFGWALFATLLGFWLAGADARQVRARNLAVELVRGAAFGAAIGWAL